MILRLIFAGTLFFLAGCATTGTGTEEPIVVAAEPENISEPPPSSVATIDEHLFVPEPEPVSEDTEQPLQHDLVWERVVHNFDLPACEANEKSLQWAQWYADRPEYMARIFKRAQPWIYFISDEIERRQIPGELALLPIVESAYDPFAYSSGRALGAWQFIASTGKNYGLNQNWWYDGRRDVWASTYAALDYLTYMSDMFDGDWLLALAGYNAGENRVAREIRKNKKAGKPTDYWNLRLPRETRGYVPKLMGLTCLFKYREQYQFDLPDTPNQPVIDAVELDQQADLVLVSQMADVPIDVMFTLNPGYNRWATSPDGPWRVVLPIENAEALKVKLQTVDLSSLMKWDQVIVESGDSLSTISARHQVPVSVIRSANDINGDLIRVGQKLRLPRDDQLSADPLYVAASMELQQLQSGLITSQRRTHRVRSGENLWVIARRYRVSVKDLQRWNNISDPRKMRPGIDLVLYQDSGQPTSAPASGTVRHVVQRGDSLWKIAQKYNVNVKDIENWNSLNGSSVLQPGQSIKIVR